MTSRPANQGAYELERLYQELPGPAQDGRGEVAAVDVADDIELAELAVGGAVYVSLSSRTTLRHLLSSAAASAACAGTDRRFSEQLGGACPRKPVAASSCGYPCVETRYHGERRDLSLVFTRCPCRLSCPGALLDVRTSSKRMHIYVLPSSNSMQIRRVPSSNSMHNSRSRHRLTRGERNR